MREMEVGVGCRLPQVTALATLDGGWMAGVVGAWCGGGWRLCRSEWRREEEESEW